MTGGNVEVEPTFLNTDGKKNLFWIFSPAHLRKVFFENLEAFFYKQMYSNFENPNKDELKDTKNIKHVDSQIKLMLSK